MIEINNLKNRIDNLERENKQQNLIIGLFGFAFLLIAIII